MVRWNAQGGNNMILNVDGSSIGNPGISGFGGLIRNSDGAWVHGFAGNMIFEYPSCRIIGSVPWINFGVKISH
jgi:hypothetical protein